MDASEKIETLEKIIDLLNNDNSLSIMAYDYNVVYCIEELIELYQNAESRLIEIRDAIGIY